MLEDKAIFNKAVQLLAQRDYSELELRKKLDSFIKRQIIKETKPSQDKPFYLSYAEENSIEISKNLQQKIEEAIIFCQNHRWLDDDSYIEKYIRMRCRSGYGRNRIILELKQRGLSLTLVDNIINESNIDWLMIAEQQLNKKFKAIIKSDMKQKAKVYRFLLSRGFLPKEVQQVYISLSYKS